MSDRKSDKEEKKLLKAVEAGEFESVLTKKRRAELVAASKNTTRKDERMHSGRSKPAPPSSSGG